MIYAYVLQQINDNNSNNNCNIIIEARNVLFIRCIVYLYLFIVLQVIVDL